MWCIASLDTTVKNNTLGKPAVPSKEGSDDKTFVHDKPMPQFLLREYQNTVTKTYDKARLNAILCMPMLTLGANEQIAKMETDNTDNVDKRHTPLIQ